MKLFYRKMGKGPAFLILHGLYGSSDNWITIGRQLSPDFEVYLLDSRNHGLSPHEMEHTYHAMASDLLEFMDDLQIKKAIIMGHSMGGKVAMCFALNHPERLSHLIVLDIAPKSYLAALDLKDKTLDHQYILETMLNFDFSGIMRRDQLDALLSTSIENASIRQFLLKNVKRDQNNAFKWILNVEALFANLEEILGGLPFKQAVWENVISGFPVLFVKAGDSDYILKEDEESVKHVFPNSFIETIEGSGHWIHVDQPGLLVELIFRFLRA
jgi:esterase